MMTAPICFSSCQARSLPHRFDKIPSFLVKTALSLTPKFKFTAFRLTIFYQTSGIVMQTVRRHRNADLIVVFVSALIVCGVAPLALLLVFFCTGTNFLIRYEDDTVWFHLDSSRCKYILLVSLQLCCAWHPFPPGRPRRD